MSGEETLRRIGMQDAGFRNPAVKNRYKPIPRHRLLTAATKYLIPPPTQALAKDTKLFEISGNRVVSVIPRDDLLDPFTDCGNGFMHPVA